MWQRTADRVASLGGPALAVAAGLLPAGLTGQEVKIPDSTQVVAIAAGRLIDAVSGRVRENVTIVVRGTRIEAVGRDVRLPEGATRIDLSAHTVMPGLMDMHTHFTGNITRLDLRALGR